MQGEYKYVSLKNSSEITTFISVSISRHTGHMTNLGWSWTWSCRPPSWLAGRRTSGGSASTYHSPGSGRRTKSDPSWVNTPWL